MISYLSNRLSGRNKTFVINTLYNYASNFLIIGLNLLMIPLFLKVLGKEAFGVWQTVLSVISFASVLNFGLGNGLRNLITKLNFSEKRTDIGIAIGTTFKKGTKIIAFSIIILIPLFLFYFHPENFFANRITPANEIRAGFLIFLVFFLINIVLSMSNSIAYGLHKSYLTGIVQLLNLLICYCTIYILDRCIKVNLIHISFVFGFIQSLSNLFFIIYQNKAFNLNIDFKKKYDLQEISNLSTNFFIVQLLALVYLSIDNFIISSTLGAAQTAEFSIVNKIFFSLIGLYSVLLIHFWNSVTEAFQKNEIQWIFKTVKILFGISLCFFLLSLAISYFQNDIISIWLQNKEFNIKTITFYLFSVYLLLHCINAIFVNLQNGLGFIKIQIYSSILSLTIYGLGCYFIDMKSYGYNVIILLKIVTMLISLLMNSLVILKLKKR